MLKTGCSICQGGFDFVLVSDHEYWCLNDDILLLQRGLGFDPFRSLNNIWSPRSTDNWGSPGSE
jgi:hypothetical protein